MLAWWVVPLSLRYHAALLSHPVYDIIVKLYTARLCIAEQPRGVTLGFFGFATGILVHLACTRPNFATLYKTELHNPSLL